MLVKKLQDIKKEKEHIIIIKYITNFRMLANTRKIFNQSLGSNGEIILSSCIGKSNLLFKG